QTTDIDLLVAVKSDADVGYLPVGDDDVRVGDRTARAVKDTPAAQDRPRHRPPPWLLAGVAVRFSLARVSSVRNAIIAYFAPSRWCSEGGGVARRAGGGGGSRRDVAGGGRPARGGRRLVAGAGSPRDAAGVARGGGWLGV